MTAEQTQLAESLRILAQGQGTLQDIVRQQAVANQTLQRQIELQAKSLEDSHARSQAEIGMLRDQMSLQTEELRRAFQSKGKSTLLDTKGLGKPSTFSGQVSDWEAWSFKLITWMGAQYPDAESNMEWAAAFTGSIGPAEIEAYSLDRPTSNVTEFNHQLYGVLVSLFDLNSEPMEIVRNSAKSMGLDAWRRLASKYDPSNPQTNLVLLCWLPPNLPHVCLLL